MTALHTIVPMLAAVSSFLLVAAVVVKRPHSRSQIMFGAGMLGFGVEALVRYLLGTATEPGHAAIWLQIIYTVGLLIPIPWALFVVALGTHGSASASVARWRLAARVGAGLALTAVVVAALLPPYAVASLAGPALVAQLTPSGRYGVIVQILATVGVLGGLEACLRTSSRDARWHIKYLLLGLGGILLVRFYVLSHTLLFNALQPMYFLSEAATLFVGNLTIGVALLRDRLLGAEIVVSRQVLFRSVIIGAAGIYLFVVGVLGWLLSWLAIPETLFWGSVVAFVSAVSLGALLLSDDVRWRVKRFLERHFYRGKYDYRHQWISFTKRLGSLVTLDELAPQLLGAVSEATGARKAALYLLDPRDGQHHLTHALGPWRVTPILSPGSGLLQAVRDGRAPVMLRSSGGHPWEGVHGPEGLTPFADVAVAVPLAWQGALVGLMLLGPERTGTPYTAEDMEFLATVSEQAAGTIVTTRLSENLARSREFEAFHRLTSFVIHDVKNAVAALSMLSRNALDNFDDRDFQRDAIKTLSRTVDRMKALLGRLSSSPDVRSFQFVELDLGALAAATAAPLVAGSRVGLVSDLQATPRVLGDPDALERVFQNLVTNAIESMDGDGRVTVRTAVRGDVVACSIADTGCGIPAQFIKKSLFVPFQSTKKGGWGIGLYQASEIVAAHRGQIEVESEEGTGTTFTMLLPAAPSSAQGAGPA
ncbi:MAG: XrtA/PEP-CTERM system histidine kinase PrsK [Candidatus Rokuibacteriota bacterium]